ncbi:MAG: hypothetical protein A2X48_08795 [Lentisphaerae bacterium GWF2_49_21]|nr:MAG: hypothetical protein A2X48_08795 [Lentisphaerae bacterium GWF2_49_21]
MVRLKDIAEKAGVSISVVSRTLNPKPDKNAYISKELRREIKLVSREMGYQRNRMAEFLKRGRNSTIGVFIPEIPNRLVADLMFGISQKASGLDFPLSFHFGISYAEYAKFIDRAAASKSGIITYPFDPSTHVQIAGLLRDYRAKGGCVIILNSYQGFKDIPVIYNDDFSGGCLAAERLISRKCGTYFAEESIYVKRSEGFNSALNEKGESSIPFKISDFEKTFTGNFKSKSRPAGIFANTDVNAFAILSVLKKMKIKPGKDVLLIGYDDLESCKYSEPPLSTVRQNFKIEGMRAVEKLVSMIYGKNEGSEAIPPSLVIRDTA